MKKLSVLVSALTFSAACNAGGWSGELTVTNTFTEAITDTIAVYTTGGIVYSPGCAANAWIIPADTTARANRAYATIMTALATGKKIRFWYQDACSLWTYHGGSSVMLVN